MMFEEGYPELPMIQKHEYYEEAIVYFYYFLTRTKNTNNLREQFDDFIHVLKTDIEKDTNEYEKYILQIYNLILHTRDQFHGKGEHDVSYMMIDVFFNHFPDIAEICIKEWFRPCCRERTIGSWRDIKYLCEYTKNNDLIEICIEVINGELAKNVDIYTNILSEKTMLTKDVRKNISNVAKWIPRENKRFGWLFERLAIQWSKKTKPYLFNQCNSENSYQSALRKAKMNYRKIISQMNKILDTTEIKLCSRKWNKLDIENIPQMAFLKYKSALCKYIFDKPDKILESSFYNENNMNRLECSLKTKKHLESKYHPEGEFEPNRSHSAYIPFSVPLSTLIKEAFYLLNNKNDEQIKILNDQWLQLSNIVGREKLGNVIPIIDMSFLSKQSDSYYTAVGFACLVAERSNFGKRILVIENNFISVNLQNEVSLYAMISKLDEETKNQIHSASDPIHAFQELVKLITSANLTRKEINDLKLIYYQTIPFVPTENYKDLHTMIMEVFTPKKCPNMIYWNLCQRNKEMILPGPINKEKCIFLSGHNANLISSLRIKKSNNYDVIMEILDKI
jgi:hypothetical protein